MTLAPAPGEIPARTHLLPALGFVLVGLLGRALIDKVLVLRGGAELVAHWAQLGSLVDSVAGVALGSLAPGLFQTIGAMEVAKVNLPVAVLIWAMIVPTSDGGWMPR